MCPILLKMMKVQMQYQDTNYKNSGGIKMNRKQTKGFIVELLNKDVVTTEEFNYIRRELEILAQHEPEKDFCNSLKLIFTPKYIHRTSIRREIDTLRKCVQVK